ncbi:hypothetical protein [Ruegeria arenilitoris]|uniref:hypothetical protein n=1 Tax=Ruegeria arenilitoris TaxID=1173585 RepID=UPI001480FF31|nr:hypothetical protein [Ruegeria arenilitoris]
MLLETLWRRVESWNRRDSLLGFVQSRIEWRVSRTEVISLVELLKGARELADLARVDSAQRSDQRQQKRIRDLISTLRLIYFSPRGVLSLLKIIAEGSYPTQDQIVLVLTDFNDAEPFVYRARHHLDPDFDRNDQALTLKAQRVLNRRGGRGSV